METLQNIAWAIVFSLVGGFVGMGLVVAATIVVPKVIDRFTPSMDEHREILRGNRAVGDYYGRLVGCAILGVSIVVAAAVLAGVMAALH